MKYLMICIFLCSLMACSSKNISLDTYKGKMIQFGSAGGFSGLETRYCLLENGNLYKIPFQGEQKKELIVQVPKNEVNQLFANYENLNFDEISSEEVGNHYYFLEHCRKKQTKKIVWSNNTNRELSILHNILYNYTK